MSFKWIMCHYPNNAVLSQTGLVNTDENSYVALFTLKDNTQCRFAYDNGYFTFYFNNVLSSTLSVGSEFSTYSVSQDGSQYRVVVWV
jgi:hypothetical protein